LMPPARMTISPVALVMGPWCVMVGTTM